MATTRQTFSTSQTLYGIVEFLGWITVVSSFVIALLVGNFHSPVLGVAVGFGGCLSGLIVVLAAQMSKAIIVTAENSYELVDLARAAARQAKAESPSATPTLTARR